MKRFYLLIALIASLSLMQSCSSNDEPMIGCKFNNGFMEAFYSNVKAFEVNGATGNSNYTLHGSINQSFFDAAVQPGMKTGFSIKVSSSDVCDSISDNAQWTALKKLYNDEPSVQGYFKDSKRMVITDPIKAIDIIALDDYDANHPAGSSLADIAYFVYLSPYYLITDAGKYSDWKMIYLNDSSNQLTPTIKYYYMTYADYYLGYVSPSADMLCVPLTSIREEQSKLIEAEDMRFMLKDTPTTIGNHKMKLKVTFTDYTVEQDIDVDLQYITKF